MIIDAHAHACGELGTIEGIMAYLQSNRLDKIVLCPGEQNSKRNYPVPMIANILPTPKIGYGFNKVICRVVKHSGVAQTLDEQNKTIGNMAREYPNQILQAYWLNPLIEKNLERMDSYYHDNPFCMIKLHQCWHNFNLCDKSICRILDWAQTYQLPIFIHILSDEQSHAFCSVANLYPACNFIVGHMLGFDVVSSNLKYDNVYFDISAPFMIPFRYLQQAVRLWGGGRLILGSDTPYGNENIRKNRLRIKQLEISECEKNRILGGSFEYLLSLRRRL